MFEDRVDAGQQLAAQLKDYKDSPIVLALPRGGVPVGFAVAKVLGVALDVIVVRKIGAPHNREFGIGAVAEGNVQVLDESTIKLLAVAKTELAEVIKKEKEELKRRVALYRNNKPLPALKNKTVILVDDGLATGVTARAAIASVKKRKPKQVIFASPVCAYDTAQELLHVVNKVVCVTTSVDFTAVGAWYRSFEQTTDAQVVVLLKRSKRRGKS